MAQDRVVMAFRKRMKKRGYKEIQIKKSALSGLYDVSAIEPVFLQEVSGKMTIEMMYVKLCPKRII